ncbi:MAG: hypothetical protein A4E33_01504 [Methanoregula sp. PtaB.Bin085]|nr:MAG: hypothetical protein A4E33_01504 [Methanoregula sp. PtaB.Bin085]
MRLKKNFRRTDWDKKNKLMDITSPPRLRAPRGARRGKSRSRKTLIESRRGSAPAGAAAGIALGGMGASAPIFDQLFFNDNLISLSRSQRPKPQALDPGAVVTLLYHASPIPAGESRILPGELPCFPETLPLLLWNRSKRRTPEHDTGLEFFGRGLVSGPCPENPLPDGSLSRSTSGLLFARPNPAISCHPSPA